MGTSSDLGMDPHALASNITALIAGAFMRLAADQERGTRDAPEIAPGATIVDTHVSTNDVIATLLISAFTVAACSNVSPGTMERLIDGSQKTIMQNTPETIAGVFHEALRIAAKAITDRVIEDRKAAREAASEVDQIIKGATP